jgi:hypothetical protein
MTTVLPIFLQFYSSLTALSDSQWLSGFSHKSAFIYFQNHKNVVSNEIESIITYIYEHQGFREDGYRYHSGKQ